MNPDETTDSKGVAVAVTASDKAIDSVDEPRRLTWFSFFQAGWRPAFAWELLAECMALTVLLMHEAWTHDLDTLGALKEYHLFLEIYFSMRFAVIGVFGAGRSAEKIAAIKTALTTK